MVRRCRNLAGIAVRAISRTWNYLVTPRGQALVGCSFTSILDVSILILCIIALSISFFRRNFNWKPRLHASASLSRFPYETCILLIYASSVWLRFTAPTILTAFLDNETRAKMWEGMDIFGGDGRKTLIMINYFVFLEVLEMKFGLKFLVKKYQDSKKEPMLPVVIEEKETIKAILQANDEKKDEVSIYEAIATTPVPSESDSLIADCEANTAPAPRLSRWQRVKNFLASPPSEWTAESVLGRFWMMVYLKTTLILSFAIIANGMMCELTPEQYFDNKVSNFMLLLVTLVLWTTRSGYVMVKGLEFARAELKERRSLAL